MILPCISATIVLALTADHAAPARASASAPMARAAMIADPPASTPQRPASDVTLRPARRYAAPGAPIMVEVDGADRDGLSVLILDSIGHGIGKPIEVPRGKGVAIDLRDAFDGVEPPERAAFVQAIIAGSPVGAPLVLEPLRAAPACRVVRNTNTGTRGPYSKIIAWGSTALPGCEEEAQGAAATWIEGDPVVTSGWRIYTERDAVIETDKGSITIAFAPDAAPGTVWNFVELAGDGFYDGTSFHRIVPQDAQGRPFVIQGGDLHGSGNGTPGYNLALEPSSLPFDYGVVGMARADEPHSAGSQFFIALSREATARLDGQYCAFAYVIDGGSTVNRIAALPIDDPASGRPAKPPTILSVKLVPAPPRVPGADRTGQRVDRASAPPADRDTR